MKTSHEWPQPPSALKSSSSRRKLTRESLASADWHKARRYESYSDGDDELLDTREPLEAACHSFAYGEGMEIQSSDVYGDSKDIQSSGYGKGKEVHIPEGGGSNGEIQEIQRSYYQDHKGLRSAGYGGCKDSSGYGDGKGFVVASITSKMSTFDREGKMNSSANHRVKLAGKPHTVRFVDAALVANEESTGFDTREPISPEVTCLGRVRIKEKHIHDREHLQLGCMRIKEKLHSHDTEQTYAEQQIFGSLSREALESRKQSMDKNGKNGLLKGSSKREITEKKSCLRMRKRREDSEPGTLKLFRMSSATVVPSETAAETRRERAAILARSLTSLLEDLRRLDMENSGYVPIVPPSNSLLLMRGFGDLKKSTNLLNRSAESSANDILLHEITTQRGMKLMQTSAEKSNASVAPSNVHKVFPLYEIESDFLVQNTSPSKSTVSEKQLAMDNSCPPQELALWQRRAIAKLAAIDTKRPMRMEVKKPNTN